MQKVRKGLQEKLNLINKIQNNLRIKKVELIKPYEKMSLDLPLLDLNSLNRNNQKGQYYLQQKTGEKLQQIKNNKLQFKDKKQYPFYSPQDNTIKGSKQTRIIFASSTSRFNSKYSPSKVTQFRTIMDEKNYNSEYLRRTFFQKTNTGLINNNAYSPKKQNKKIKELTFYGRINEINHVAGSRFKTFDETSRSLQQVYMTREQIQKKITNRLENRSNFINGETQSASLPLMTNNPENLRNIFKNNQNHNRSKRNRQKNKSDLMSFNNRYSPWNNQQTQQAIIWQQNNNLIPIQRIGAMSYN